MHVWRFVLDVPLQIGAWHVARSLSGIAAVGAAALAVWAFKSAGADKTPKVVYS
jgi:hypothetical protein